ncbi:hypothetical protein Bhyg_06597, partial [Pseudolycoriella hygida]
AVLRMEIRLLVLSFGSLTDGHGVLEVIIWTNLEHNFRPKAEEDFQSFETKIDQVMKILQMMNSKDAVEQCSGNEMADRYLGTDRQYQDMLKMDDFVVKVKENRTIINKVKEDDTASHSMGKNAFMAEMERDAAR